MTGPFNGFRSDVFESVVGLPMVGRLVNVTAAYIVDTVCVQSLVTFEYSKLSLIIYYLLFYLVVTII